MFSNFFIVALFFVGCTMYYRTKKQKVKFCFFLIYGAPSRTPSTLCVCGGNRDDLAAQCLPNLLVVEPVVAFATRSVLVLWRQTKKHGMKAVFLFVARPAGLEPATHRLEIITKQHSITNHNSLYRIKLGFLCYHFLPRVMFFCPTCPTDAPRKKTIKKHSFIRLKGIKPDNHIGVV